MFIHATVLSQLGVNTNNPLADVHVAGQNSMLRVDGLNNINNPNNLGNSEFYNLSVDGDGSFKVSPQSGLLSSDINLTSGNSIIQSATNSDFNNASLYQKNFTLSNRALVVISYTISIEFKSFNGLSNINDGRTKVAQNYFYLGDGVNEDTSKTYGISSCSYSNYTCDTATGYVYNSRSIMVPLEAGTHSIHMKGAVFGGGITSNASFSGIFGANDRLDIQVIYL